MNTIGELVTPKGITWYS